MSILLAQAPRQGSGMWDCCITRFRCCVAEDGSAGMRDYPLKLWAPGANRSGAGPGLNDQFGGKCGALPLGRPVCHVAVFSLAWFIGFVDAFGTFAPLLLDAFWTGYRGGGGRSICLISVARVVEQRGLDVDGGRWWGRIEACESRLTLPTRIWARISERLRDRVSMAAKRRTSAGGLNRRIEGFAHSSERG
ncbi:hypothetical protein DFH07DRAFT_775125 [Mycena maculata]|uniref:Uncharacterized protein n=1 Tax=Mycena maculata TaxID=230809 RepID=A0AAD7IV61_9AGAR|nr:hypothetical protein DFH07DRAFT_775125 [Mycena maculata]